MVCAAETCSGVDVEYAMSSRRTAFEELAIGCITDNDEAAAAAAGCLGTLVTRFPYDVTTTAPLLVELFSSSKDRLTGNGRVNEAPPVGTIWTAETSGVRAGIGRPSR